ncbi:MAG: response regulator, partial [Proteobacteria bacterium]|nr:response regulator [Pseudomonadota bacterium]
RSIGDGVITTDVEGRIVLINRVAEVMTGWTHEEAAGKPLHDIFHIINEKTRQRSESPVENVIETGGVTNFHNHTVLVARDGTERIIADSGAPIFDSESKIIGVVLVFQDITEKRKTEEELLKTQKLESIGLLAGGIAHDFNNVLTAIIGNISLAKMYAKPGDKIFERLEETEKASLGAKDLTQQLLTFSKGGEPIKKTVAFLELISDSAGFALRGANVRCEFSMPDDLWPVEVDEGQMGQVINNLIINASQAMPEGGIIKVRAENMIIGPINVLPLKPGRYIKISIQDRGIGIQKEHLSRIFDPYFTTKQKGTGLGLTTVYSIIDKHDGHITAESELGVGTTFHIYLPASGKEITKSKDMETHILTGKGKILVMDDEEIVRDIVGEMLKHLGYEVAFAEDGAEAIEMYRNSPFDVVMMDLTIPGGMGGKEAIKKLLEIDPGARAIVSSGYSNDPVMANFEKYGFAGVVSKPYKIEELGKALYKVITGKDSWPLSNVNDIVIGK